MKSVPDSFDRFFELYPQGFCFFLLAGEDKCVLFGPKIEYTFVTEFLNQKSERMIDDLRSLLNEQIGFNLNGEHEPQNFCLFFCERQQCEPKAAISIAKNFQNFLNTDVFAKNKSNYCINPINLKSLSYLGYGGGIGLDKKKDFATLIFGYQDEFEISDRKKVTLEVTHENISLSYSEPVYIYKYDSNKKYLAGMFSSGVLAFVPLFFLALRK